METGRLHKHLIPQQNKKTATKLVTATDYFLFHCETNTLRFYPRIMQYKRLVLKGYICYQQPSIITGDDMSRDYDEKRDFFRMTADCPLSFNIHGDEASNTGQCINLSAGGIRFRSAIKLEPATLIDIHITPEKSVVPPLKAVIEVTRREPSSEEGQYEYAGSIKQLL